MREVIPNNIYRHFKGKLYKVICTATHTENSEEFVVYQSLYGDYNFWVRSKTLFLEKIIIDGIEIDRFSSIADESEIQQ